MEKITSFTIDHLKLLPGLYVSRKDTAGDTVITTFDIRMTQPNAEPVINTAEIHTIEHLGATFLRNQEGIRDIVPLMRNMFDFIRSYEGEVPGASARDCGNYLDMNLPMARFVADKYYREVLDQIDDSRMVYPED